MNDKYLLDENLNPVLCDDIIPWARQFEAMDRRVASDKINGVDVSTVFLGLDHNFMDDGPPLLYETMIFGGDHNGYQERYSTRQEALDGHEKAKKLVTNLKVV